MIRTFFEEDSTERCALLARILEERASTQSAVGMRSAGGWHTKHHKLGQGWLGEAMKRRIERAGLSGAGPCWGNVLPIGSSYEAHVHRGQELVAVWMLAGTSELRFEEGIVVLDLPGQLTVFPGTTRHWVPTVTSERVTVAANLG